MGPPRGCLQNTIVLRSLLAASMEEAFQSTRAISTANCLVSTGFQLCVDDLAQECVSPANGDLCFNKAARI